MKLYGFFHTTCVYESAPALLSLHKTKQGALKAMIEHQWKAWEEANKDCRRFSRKEIKSFKKEDECWNGWSRKDRLWRKAYVHCNSFVKSVEVKE